MIKDRRNFIFCSGMAAGGALLTKFAMEQPFTEGASAEGDVSLLVSRYGRVDAMKKASSGEIHVKAKIFKHSRMSDLYTKQHLLPMDKIRCTPDNKIEFTHRGEKFVISHSV